VITGPVLGVFLIFANLSAVLVNLIGSVVFALLIPYIAIGRTLLYFDLGAREAEAEAAGGQKRRRLRLRPRPATGTS
jgi:hypothetical protein